MPRAQQRYRDRRARFKGELEQAVADCRRKTASNTAVVLEAVMRQIAASDVPLWPLMHQPPPFSD